MGLYPIFLVEYYNSARIRKYQPLSLPRETRKNQRKVYVLMKQGKSEDKDNKKIVRILRTYAKS